MTAADGGRPRALIIDYGGVLTTPLSDCLAAWCESDGVELAELHRVLRGWVVTRDPGSPDSPIPALERGELPATEFERALAAQLRTRSGGRVVADGLLRRMFAAFTPEPRMTALLTAVRAAGARTALLSNSWGNDYPRQGWDQLFDAVVISAEVGMRKPEPEVYRYTADLLAVPPGRCVFVDDLAMNVSGARAVGMTGLQHDSVPGTVARLRELFGLDAGGAAGAAHDTMTGCPDLS